MRATYTLSDGLTLGVEHIWPLAALPVAVAVLAYVVFRSERGSRSASARSRRLLFASRVLVATLLVVGAMGPYTVQTRETPGEPSVTLLTDESASMDVYADTRESLVADIEATGVPVTTTTVGSEDASRLGDGLAANVQENGTVVVLSDGQVTDGRSLAVAGENARQLNATVSAVELIPRRREAAVSVAGPETVSSGVPSRFVVSVDGVRLPEESTVEVAIDGEVVATKTVGENGTAAVTHTFDDLGSHRVTATLESEDVFERNDVFYKSVRVVEKPDVLYVSARSYPFENFLRSLYDVTTADSVPADLSGYSTVVVQDSPAARFGNVSSLQEHVIEGGGLVVVGGDNAYENGGYGESPVASMLPVSVGNATGGTTNIVLLIDVSGSAEQGMAIQKSVALDVLDQLGDENRVGVVAFNFRAFRVAELAPLAENRATVGEQIRRLTSGGATDISVGLQGADELLGQREGTIILLSDGQDRLDRAAAVSNQLGREGTRVVSVGAGRKVNERTLREIAAESGGSYFAATETNRLRLLFGGGSRRFQGDKLTIVTRDTFITSGVELTANPGQANRVTVKPGADYQVATADGTRNRVVALRPRPGRLHHGLRERRHARRPARAAGLAGADQVGQLRHRRSGANPDGRHVDRRRSRRQGDVAGLPRRDPPRGARRQVPTGRRGSLPRRVHARGSRVRERRRRGVRRELPRRVRHVRPVGVADEPRRGDGRPTVRAGRGRRNRSTGPPAVDAHPDGPGLVVVGLPAGGAAAVRDGGDRPTRSSVPRAHYPGEWSPVSVIGRTLNLGLVALIVLAVAGTAGATVFYQDSTGELQTQNDRLKDDNAELREELEETREDLRENRSRVRELQRTLETRTQDVDQVAADLERTESQLNATESQLAETRQELRASQERVGELQTAASDLRAENRRLETRANNLEDEVEELETDRRQLQDDVENLQDDVENLQNELEDREDEVDSLEQEVINLEDENEDLRQENRELDDDLASLCNKDDNGQEPECDGY
nr:VWA domain-containing protein [Halomicroarcula sp. SYNS111]